MDTYDKVEELLDCARELSSDDPILGNYLLLAAAASLCRNRELFLQTAAEAFDGRAFDRTS